MFPVLVRIGPLTIHTYGFLIATGFLVALWLALRQAKRKGFPPEQITDVGFYVLLAGLIGARFFYVLTEWSHFAANPLAVLKIWEGGLVFYGGVLAGIPTVIWYTRRKGIPIWPLADVWAPSIAIGHAIGRLGCFCAGCCYGGPAEGLPWAVTFTHPESLAIQGIPLHPAQLYEALGEAVNFMLLMLLRRYQSFNGQLFWTYVLNYAVIRSLVEPFRGDQARGFLFSGISIAQGLSVLLFLTALVSLLVLRKRERL